MNGSGWTEYVSFADLLKYVVERDGLDRRAHPHECAVRRAIKGDRPKRGGACPTFARIQRPKNRAF